MLEFVGSSNLCWNLNALDDDIPVCLVNTIEGLDATLHRTVIGEIRENADQDFCHEVPVLDQPRFSCRHFI